MGRRTTPLMRAKIAEFTPMASANVITATMVNPGVLISCRKAKRKSWIIRLAFPLRCSGPRFWIQGPQAIFCSRRPVGEVVACAVISSFVGQSAGDSGHCNASHSEAATEDMATALLSRLGVREKRIAAGDPFQIPQARGAVAARGREIGAVGRKFDGPKGIKVAAEDGDALFGFVVPEPRGVVPAHGYDARTIRCEAGGVDRTGVAF